MIHRSDYAPIVSTLVRYYSTLLTIQFAFGLVLLVSIGNEAGWNMRTLRGAVEHSTTMIIALGLAHACAAFKKSPAAVRSRKTLLLIVASLLLIFVGVMRLKGIEYWFVM